MSFVDRYLFYFRQQLIIHPLSALLPFQSLFTENSVGDKLLALPPFSGVLRAPGPLCCVFLFSSLFIIQFFLGGGLEISLSRGYAGLFQGWLWEYCLMLGAHLLVCWMSSKQVWSQCLEVWEPSCNVAWRRFYGLGVQVVQVSIFLGAFFLPSVAPAPQQDF
jgi:hypothetical protein